MAVMIPSTVHAGTNSHGEHEVFRRLRDDPHTENWIVLHSLDMAFHDKQVAGEIDFLIIVPSKGIICLEVKACSRLRREQGGWYYGQSPTSDARGPFKQASQAMHSLRKQLIADVPELKKVVFWSAVLFPYVDFSINSFEWHPWQVIDAKQFRSQSIGMLIESVIDNARGFLADHPGAKWFKPVNLLPSPQQCTSIVGSLRPKFEFVESSRSLSMRRNEEIKHYTREQYQALDAMEVNSRVFFEGPAGTGKTLLAVEAARRASLNERRVLLVCYNRLLGKWLEAQTRDLVGLGTTSSLHRYMLKVAELSVPSEAGSHFWDVELPQKAIEKLIENDTASLFDEIVVDEAQDIMNEHYLDFLDLILAGGLNAGRWRFFGDFEKQSIYYPQSVGLMMKQLSGAPKFSLRTNCRNTPRIASLTQFLGALNPGYSRVLRSDDGVEPELHYYNSQEHQTTLLAGALRRLEDEGFSAHEVVVLSPLTEDACIWRISCNPWQRNARPFEINDHTCLRFSTIHAFKGLESPAVVLTDVVRIDDETSNNLFYVAATRALHRLIILADEKAKPGIRDILLHQ